MPNVTDSTEDISQLLRRVDNQRRQYTGDGPDPVLTAIADMRCRRADAEQRLRPLIAYAREVIRPRGCRLADLAVAAGMSVSGVRIAYSQQDIQVVHQRLRS